MLMGAICGDIIGSIYESWFFQDKVDDLSFAIFSSASIFTDDTCLTVAIADAILNNVPYEESILKWYTRYPNRGYGAGFVNWVEQYQLNKSVKNNSYSNGAMMRVSSIGLAFDTIDDVIKEVDKSVEFSHNNNEARCGARAIACAVFLAKIGKSKLEIRNFVESTFGYNLNYTIDEVRSSFDHRTTRCDVTAPQSLIVFLNSNDYEHTLRNAIFSRGDVDTIAAISGGIAGTFYKRIPADILNFSKSKLPLDMINVVKEFDKKYLTF